MEPKLLVVEIHPLDDPAAVQDREQNTIGGPGKRKLLLALARIEPGRLDGLNEAEVDSGLDGYVEIDRRMSIERVKQYLLHVSRGPDG